MFVYIFIYWLIGLAISFMFMDVFWQELEKTYAEKNQEIPSRFLAACIYLFIAPWVLPAADIMDRLNRLFN